MSSLAAAALESGSRASAIAQKFSTILNSGYGHVVLKMVNAYVMCALVGVGPGCLKM
jgi:hypothetical protein